MDSVRIETSIDYPTYRDYFLHQITHTKRMRLFFILSAVAALLMLASFVLTWSSGGSLTSWDYIPLLILVGVYAFYSIFFRMMTKRQYERNQETFTFQTEYVFHPEVVKITAKGRGEDEGLEVAYKQFGEVVETNKYLYLYVDVQRCYIVRKDGVQSGTIDQLRTWLKGGISGPYRQGKSKR